MILLLLDGNQLRAHPNTQRDQHDAGRGRVHSEDQRDADGARAGDGEDDAAEDDRHDAAHGEQPFAVDLLRSRIAATSSSVPVTTAQAR